MLSVLHVLSIGSVQLLLSGGGINLKPCELGQS